MPCSEGARRGLVGGFGWLSHTDLARTGHSNPISSPRTGIPEGFYRICGILGGESRGVATPRPNREKPRTLRRLQTNRMSGQAATSVPAVGPGATSRSQA